MSYQNRLNEITEKLSRLATSGGVTRPLVPVENGGTGAAQAQKYQEILGFFAEIKEEFNLFRRETVVELKEIKMEVKKLAESTSAFGKSSGKIDNSGGIKDPGKINNSTESKDLKGREAADDSFGDILEELSALKAHIKSALDFDKS